MNKKIILISALSLLLVGCSGKQSDGSSISSSIESSSEVLTDHHLRITYLFESGEIYDTVDTDMFPGTHYNFVAPEINFMTPSMTTIQGDMPNEDVEYRVVYKYSDQPLTDLTKGQEFDPVMVDYDKGLSFTFTLSGGETDWEAMFVGETFTIYNGCFEARDNANATTYKSRWYEPNGVLSNGAVWNSLLGDNKVVTCSLNPDGTYVVYKNGQRIFTWMANLYASYQSGLSRKKVTSDFIDNALNEISEDGFRLGLDKDYKSIKYKMDNLTLDYAVNDQQALEKVKDCTFITVHYVDDKGNDLTNPSTNLVTLGEEYTFYPPAYTGMSVEPASISGIAEGDEDVYFVFTKTSEASEHIFTPLVNDRSSAGNWGDTSNWLTITEPLTGNFEVKTKYHMEGGKNGKTGGDICWQTYLSIIAIPTNLGQRFVSRLDWYGWQDGSIASGPSTFSNWFTTHDYNTELPILFANCDTEVTYERINNNLTITTKLIPLNAYFNGETFIYVVTLSNLTAPTLGIYLNGEFCYTRVDSVIY